MKRRVYLDHLSGGPLAPEVRAAMRPWLEEIHGNAASLHRHGLKAREALDTAAAQCAAMINAPADDLVFTSSGTEANNLAVKGVAEAQRERGTHLILSNIEHPSIDQSVAWLEQQGFTATRVPVDREGRLSVGAVTEAITEQTILIATHHANHDLGAVQNLPALGALAGERGIPLLIDATASGGWLPVDVTAHSICLLTLAPHRFGGPQGVGVLYRNPRVPLAPQLHGGVQQGGLRAGTENLAAIVGAGAGAALPAIEVTPLQQQLHGGLLERIEQMTLNGPKPGPNRLPTQLNYSLAGLEGEGLALALDMQGVAIASGTACVTQNLGLPPALAAIGLDAAQAKGNVLLSLGRDTTAADIDHVLEIIPKQVDKLRTLSPTWDA
ncbi:MAG TPA: cysteine desulfurase NifS [Verrucomicrobiales bacterium]|nr:cysteine desulfurase NifS [Verrucomicrobiales bacterium]|tara:strand:+ start:670 stop:1818 length:1149 start_codon:yes stop_codon:yes gene_type:complete